MFLYVTWRQTPLLSLSSQWLFFDFTILLLLLLLFFVSCHYRVDCVKYIGVKLLWHMLYCFLCFEVDDKGQRVAGMQYF